MSASQPGTGLIGDEAQGRSSATSLGPFLQVREAALFENQLLSYKQAAQYLSVSEPFLRKLKSRGLVPFVLIGDRGVRFRVSSLNQWIEEREVK
ncbi:MAG TPA: helix-turn-helix domain-containing protein [Bdellovibrionota bacterium]|nr:helix-turn-helix domain-containing protein [Bdellovibrionota bacterium]